MRFDPFDAAAHVPTAAHFERLGLEYLGGAVGYDVAFTGMKGASVTSVGMAADLVERATQPGSEYEVGLAPVKEAAAEGASFLEAFNVDETGSFSLDPEIGAPFVFAKGAVVRSQWLLHALQAVARRDFRAARCDGCRSGGAS